MNGLKDEEVLSNRKKYGDNTIGEYQRSSFIRLVIQSLGDPIIRILLIALAVKTIFLFQNFDWYETIGIVLAIIFASFISSISEYGSDKAFQSLMKEASKISCKVIRNGKKKIVTIDDIVCEDIVLLESGDVIPADGLIIKGNIIVDESKLNGESKSCQKKYSDQVLRGSTILNGEALMKVESVGKNTFYGKMAQGLNDKRPTSPLKERLTTLAKQVSIIGYVGSLIVFISYIIIYGFNVSNIIRALTLSVTIIIVCVPEGLPMMLTLVLSSNMKKMLKNNVLVRKLNGIETAGSLNILFTDKTGTLTKGELEVIRFVDGNLKEYTYDELIKTKLSRLVKISCSVNNSSSFDNNTIIGGNITDKAILKFIKNNNISYEKINVIPFNSNNKYMITTIDDNGLCNLIKGAPESIIPHLKYYYNDLENKERINIDKITSYIDKKTSEGSRVIMLALSYNKDPEYFDNLILVGLLIMKDEVREHAYDGLKMVRDAHIKTVMLTGDNKNTACSIAKELDIYNDSDIALTSEELNKLSDDELKKIIPKLSVVARMLPHDKSRLVRICQEMDLVVGMTGDGVNDAPALKRADVGFSMGSASEVSKEASDIVILDNNFYSIAMSILYGRTIFKSIRKFIILQLTINICALSLSILGPFIGIDTPITVIQMLWINMVMDTLAGLSYAFEPPLKEYMKELPKKKKEPILNHYMMTQILWTGILSSLMCIIFLKVRFIYNDVDNLLTAFFGLFIFIDIFNSFNARTNSFNLFKDIRKNKVFIMIMIIVTITQLMLLYFGGSLFRTTRLNLNELLFMILFAFLVIPIDLVRKIYLTKKNNNVGV